MPSTSRATTAGAASSRPLASTRLFCYLVGTVLAIAFGAVRFGINAEWRPHHRHTLIHDGCQAITWSPEAASCLYAITFVLITWCFGYILYKKKIYIKI